MRLAGKLKLGFFPLPVEHGPSIRARLSFPPAETPATVLDPCAGTGSALRAITEKSGSVLYGVELDANRAEAAQAAGIRVIHGNAFDVRCRVQRLSLLYLNPPYDFEIGPLANERMERLFLGHTYSWLVPKGVLVMVIPRKAILQTLHPLASRFRDIRIYRMNSEESRKYDQYAIFAVRHDNNGNEADAIREGIKKSLEYGGMFPDLTIEADCEYAVPRGQTVELSYNGIPLDQVEDHLGGSEAWKKASKLLLPKVEVVEGRPITPLHGGHVGLIATAGMLNGTEGNTDDDRHIARWRPLKHTTVTVEYEDETEIVRTKERFSNELALVFQNGDTRLIDENGAKSPHQIHLVTTENVDEDEAGDSAEDDSESNSEYDRAYDALAVCDNESAIDEDAGPTPEPPPTDGRRFQPGRLIMTPGIQELVAFKGLNVTEYLDRHLHGDWGEAATAFERRQNDLTVIHDGAVRSIISSYSVPEAPAGLIWIHTEADRSSTTILLPREA